MIPEVRACSGYLVITAQRAYRDNAGACLFLHFVWVCSECAGADVDAAVANPVCGFSC